MDQSHLETLVQGLAEDLQNASSQLSRMAVMQVSFDDGTADFEDAESHTAAQDAFRGSLEKADLIIRACLELSDLPSLRAEYSAQFESQRQHWTDIDFQRDEAENSFSYSSPVLNLLYRYLSLLESYTGARQREAIHRIPRKVLMEILKNSAEIVDAFEILPEQERDVYDQVYKVVSWAFPDSIKHPSVSNSARNYLPEFGIPSIETIVEFKYATTEEEVYTAVSGLYADTCCYHGSKDWNRFIGVIYMTESFVGESRLKAHAKRNGLPDNWEWVIVVGDGTRKKKKTASKLKEENADSAKDGEDPLSNTPPAAAPSSPTDPIR